MIKVLIVDDSATAREALAHLLGGDPDIEVVATVADGEQALQAVLAHAPDAITMDINMPGMNGLEATRRIMETRPTPIIVVSAHIPAEEAATFQAMEAGALAVIRRPPGLETAAYEEAAQELRRTVKTMAEVKLVKRWPRLKRSISGSEISNLKSEIPLAPTEPRVLQPPEPGRPAIKLVVMGGSTGAPAVIEAILKRLPRELPFPILIVQHIAAGFIEGFAQWLGRSTARCVQVAQQDEKLVPGVVYLARDDFHARVTAEGTIALTRDPPEQGVRPAICALFRSAAYSFGARAAGVLLSGMGADGAAGLKLMRERGGITIVQSPETAVISSMPAEALRREAAELVLSPEAIADYLSLLASASADKSRP